MLLQCIVASPVFCAVVLMPFWANAFGVGLLGPEVSTGHARHQPAGRGCTRRRRSTRRALLRRDV